MPVGGSGAGSSTGTPSARPCWIQHPPLGNVGMGQIWTRANASPRPFRCWFVSAAITGTVPAPVEGGRPLPGSLTGVKRASSNSDLGISTGSFSSLPTGAVSEPVRGCGGAAVFHPVPWFGSSDGFGGEFLARRRERFLFPSSWMAGSGSEPSRCRRRTARRRERCYCCSEHLSAHPGTARRRSEHLSAHPGMA